MNADAPVELNVVQVVHLGLGPVGREVAKLVAERPNLMVVGAVDLSPDLRGKDFWTTIERTRNGPNIKISSTVRDTAILDKLKGQRTVAIICTGSSLKKVVPQILECIDLGMSVVSTCEELSFPWKNAPELASILDAAAKKAGVAVLGTGVNPGFVMDFFPVVSTGIAKSVDRVFVHRVQDAGTRRIPLQKKVGAGLTTEEFQARVEAGLVRHVGLEESVDAIASAFGWNLTRTTSTIEPICAGQETPSGLGNIAKGRVTGVRQLAKGFIGSKEVVSLLLEMAVGISSPRDEINISGVPNFSVVIPGGLHGDIATAAITVNSIFSVLRSGNGLKVMTEIVPPRPIINR